MHRANLQNVLHSNFKSRRQINIFIRKENHMKNKVFEVQMAVTKNVNLLRSIFEYRGVCVFKREYSEKGVLDSFFKFHSDSEKIEDRYKPLSENDYKRFVTSRSARRQPALTRQIASLAYKVGKDVLSLAEGMPNEDAFPFTKLSLEMSNGKSLVLEGSEMGKALQYVPSQGLPSLLTELRAFQQELHRPPPLDRDIIVTNGGQHGIYQCVELLLEPGDPILTTQYAYTGLHSALKPYNPEILGIPEDDSGMITDHLDTVLGDRLKKGLKMPKLLYIIPTGNNPTGTILSEERRREVYEMACRYDFLILEDDPYMFLNYSGKQVPSFLSLDTCGRVLRIDSMSKVVSSGLRAGWVTAPKPLLHRLELHSQAELLHSCTLAQVLMQHLISNRVSHGAHLLSARELYRARRDALYSALTDARALTHCPLPDAGLFFWMKVHGVEDVYNMVFEKAFQRGLMLIPGHAFVYDTKVPCQYLRLTFSKIKYEDMETAVGHLSEIIRDLQRETADKRAKRIAS